jgi:hypothetical protein
MIVKEAQDLPLGALIRLKHPAFGDQDFVFTGKDSIDEFLFWRFVKQYPRPYQRGLAKSVQDVRWQSSSRQEWVTENEIFGLGWEIQRIA